MIKLIKPNKMFLESIFEVEINAFDGDLQNARRFVESVLNESVVLLITSKKWLSYAILSSKYKSM